MRPEPVGGSGLRSAVAGVSGWSCTRRPSPKGRAQGAGRMRGRVARIVRPLPPRLKAACGAATRLGCAEALTRGSLTGLRAEGTSRPTARPREARATLLLGWAVDRSGATVGRWALCLA